MIPIESRSKIDCPDREIRQFTEHRMSFALDRFQSLRRIVVFIEDVNGPKGGPDKLCRIVAEFRFAEVVVEEVQLNWQSSVAHAFRRVARKTARELGRVNRSCSHGANRNEATAARLHDDAPELL